MFVAWRSLAHSVRAGEYDYELALVHEERSASAWTPERVRRDVYRAYMHVQHASHLSILCTRMMRQGIARVSKDAESLKWSM